MTTCFLIEDDFDDQEIFSMALLDAHPDMKCVNANDGAQALQKLMVEPDFTPDCIFIDMNMPKMNGRECLEAIRKIDRLKNVPVYMYSTSKDPKMVIETKALGANDFFMKPSSVDELTKEIKNALRPS